MDMSKKCQYCSKVFFDSSTRNRHIKKIHKRSVEDKRKNHIICPLCRNDGVPLGTYDNLTQHLNDTHMVDINTVNLTFFSQQEYEKWTEDQRIEVNYVMIRRKKINKNLTEVHYGCNRSNRTEYNSKCKIRTEKAGGSKKIQGVCPSRLIVKQYSKGEISIIFFLTHVGHEEEIRSQRLSKVEENIIADKLKMGVTMDRILEDARKLENDKLTKFNMLTRKDLNNLARKHKIDKKRQENDMVAVALKVQEWNDNGKNSAFFFKRQGEKHAVLKDEDFAVGFMNTTMKNKLRDFGNIICIDGTRCTNRRDVDLTMMLTKDDTDVGFPVAFFLSNRRDQVVQEIFLNAIQETLDFQLKPEYLMTDDDPKYYDAWLNIVRNTPRRLLCTWHVVKNWNIQGKCKIKNLEIKKTMKMDIRKILTETKKEKFNSLREGYFNKLIDADEVDFLNYLQRYYFQSEERISMWAHCYRLNAGINTNVALESLNNLLKTDQSKRRANITIEKLLDKIEELADAEMWRRILTGATNSVLQDALEKPPGQRKEHHKEEIREFVSVEEIDNQETSTSDDEEEVRKIGNQEVLNFLNGLAYETYLATVKNILKIEETNIGSRKRKMGTQQYYPRKKCRPQ